MHIFRISLIKCNLINDSIKKNSLPILSIKEERNSAESSIL